VRSRVDLHVPDLCDGVDGVLTRDGESGFTLVELLATIAIMGLAIVGLLGALGTFLQAGTIERSTANIDQVSRVYTEALVSAPYGNCATAYASVTLTAGYSFAAGPTVRYWNGDSPATFATTCATDRGVQQVSGTVKDNSSGQSQPVAVAKTEAG
jgi:prepilin-type N-terminal cleavage/methylation domain-containing protein